MANGTIHLSILVATLGAGVGCERVKVDGPGLPFTSGTRLRARVLDGGEGATLFRGFFDSELGMRCSFDLGEDGKMRCLPQEGFGYEYGDAGCTQAVYVHYCGTQPTFVREQPLGASSCGPQRIKANQLTTQTVPATFYKDGDGNCFPNGTLAPDATAYLVGAPAGPDTFVGAELRDVPLSNGLVVKRLEADDGTRLLVAASDSAGRDCYPSILDGDPEDMRCVPSRTAYSYDSGGYFRDAACTESVAFDFAGTAPGCPLPDVVQRYESSGTCAGTVSYAEVGAEIDSALVYSSSTGTCELLAPTSGEERFFQAGAPIEWTSFAELAREDVGAGRLVVPHFAGLQGELLTSIGEFFDTERNERCYAYETEGAGMRCIPSSAQSSTGVYYGNSACSDDARLHLTYQDVCSGPIPAMVYASTNTNCETIVSELHLLGAEHQAPVYYKPDPSLDDCLEYMMPAPQEHFYVVGESVALTTMPAITAKTE